MKKCLLVLFTAFLVLPALAQNDDDVYYNNTDYSNEDYAGGPSGPTYQEFYDQLAPYGNWITYPGYGYAWVPNQVGADFSPYLTNGQWLYTQYGWTWYSEYAWGWGPFHYGRWFYDAAYGWVWVPGYDWAPAWVIWGDYGDYYCWAPIWPGEAVGPAYRPKPDYWHFIEHHQLGVVTPEQHVVNTSTVTHNRNDDAGEINNHINIISHANTFGQSVFFAGPKASEVEKLTGHKPVRLNFTPSEKPKATSVNAKEVSMYRPGIMRTNKQPAPPVTEPRTTGKQNIPNNPGQNQQAPAPVENDFQQNTYHPNWEAPRQPVQQPAPVNNNYQNTGRTFVPVERPAPPVQQPVQHVQPMYQSRPVQASPPAQRPSFSAPVAPRAAPQMRPH